MLRSEIAGIPISSLTEKFPTPFFVYDADSIRKRTGELKKFDIIRFAQKACSNLAILRLLKGEGCAVDCVSANEIRRALLAGFNDNANDNTKAKKLHNPVVFTADIFDRETLDLVVSENIPVNCGSTDMIRQLGEQAPDREITLRINPGFGHGHSRKTNTGGDQSKHGIWFTQIDECKKIAAQYNLKISGLHTHIGSGTDFEHQQQVCEYMGKFAEVFGPDLEMLSTGGGLPIPYRQGEVYIDIDRYFEMWNTVRNRLEDKFGHKIRLETEPGRYIVAESGYLVTEIRAVKTQGENLFYLVDAGFNNLARPIMYGAYHPISIAKKSGADFIESADYPTCDVTIGGPLCESGDIFTQEEGGFVVKRQLPRAEVGDFLIIEIAGAYGSVMGSNYNSKPHAAEVLVENGSSTLIRKKQTFEHLIQNEM